jgi:hypothetical protein
MSLVVRTLSEQIFDILKEKIVGGQLDGKQPIRQDALAADLGVSKIPCARRWPGWNRKGCSIHRPIAVSSCAR